MPVRYAFATKVAVLIRKGCHFCPLLGRCTSNPVHLCQCSWISDPRGLASKARFWFKRTELAHQEIVEENACLACHDKSRCTARQQCHPTCTTGTNRSHDSGRCSFRHHRHAAPCQPSRLCKSTHSHGDALARRQTSAKTQQPLQDHVPLCANSMYLTNFDGSTISETVKSLATK